MAREDHLAHQTPSAKEKMKSLPRVQQDRSGAVAKVTDRQVGSAVPVEVARRQRVPAASLFALERDRGPKGPVPFPVKHRPEMPPSPAEFSRDVGNSIKIKIGDHCCINVARVQFRGRIESGVSEGSVAIAKETRARLTAGYYKVRRPSMGQIGDGNACRKRSGRVRSRMPELAVPIVHENGNA